ncbi:MAG: LuxR C-terminal-related transcriptional regulator [Actinomycetota bacterium]
MPSVGTLGSIALSAREREILQLAAWGCSNREIGMRLYISSDTVKTHLEHACGKLDVAGRTAAVAEALRRGLIT